jgi:hypothetical protein
LEKSQSGGLKKSGNGGRQMPPDSGGKVKKKKKVFLFNNLALLNLDFKKNIAKQGKKSRKTNYSNNPMLLLKIELFTQFQWVPAVICRSTFFNLF